MRWMPAIFTALTREWLRIGRRACARSPYLSRSNVPSAQTATRLHHLIQALAPLGMPDIEHGSGKGDAGWVARARWHVRGVITKGQRQ